MTIKKILNKISINTESITKTLEENNENYDIIEKNLLNIYNSKVYRGTSIKWLIGYLKNPKLGISNYTNSYSEAEMYSKGVILEFSYNYDNGSVNYENIENRGENIQIYDGLILEKKIDGYYWYVGLGEYHFRIKNKLVKLEKIYFNAGSLKENIANLSVVNRKYAGLSQIELASKLGTKQPKIAQYENGKRLPEINRLLELGSYLPYSQTIKGDIDLIINQN